MTSAVHLLEREMQPTERLEEIISIRVTARSASFRNEVSRAMPTYLRKSRDGCAELTLHQLLMNTLKILRVITRNAADHYAMKPTATMMQAASPMTDTKNRAIVHWPRIMNPMNRKMRRTRPASRKLRDPRQTHVWTFRDTLHSLFLAVAFADGRQTCEPALPREH